MRPDEGDAAAIRLTIPLNPCWAVTVIVELPETPARTVEEVGLAETVKSCTVSVTVAE